MNYTVKIESELIVALRRVQIGDSFNMSEQLHVNNISLIGYTAKQRKAQLSITVLPKKKVQIDFTTPNKTSKK